MAEHKHLLFLVCFDRVDKDGDDIENFDLFVVAKDAAEAEKLWHAHYHESREDVIERCGLDYSPDKKPVEIDDDEIEANRNISTDQRPSTVFLVPTAELLVQSPHPIAWSAVQRFDT